MIVFGVCVDLEKCLNGVFGFFERLEVFGCNDVFGEID